MSKPSAISHQPSTVFNDYARYYDLLYQDKDYQAEADYVAGLMKRFHLEARSILKLGSGTGIHASLLAKKRICCSRCGAQRGHARPVFGPA